MKIKIERSFYLYLFQYGWFYHPYAPWQYSHMLGKSVDDIQSKQNGEQKGGGNGGGVIRFEVTNFVLTGRKRPVRCDERKNDMSLPL